MNTPNGSTETMQAEDALARSIAKFESAMEKLTSKVENTSHSIQHMFELARHQKDELIHLKNKAREVVDPVMPYIHKVESAGRKVAVNVKENPRPYMWVALGVTVGILTYMYGHRSQVNFGDRNQGVPY